MSEVPTDLVPRQISQITVWYYEKPGRWKIDVQGYRRVDESGHLRRHYNEEFQIQPGTPTGDVLELAGFELAQCVETLGQVVLGDQAQLDLEPF